MKIRDVTQYLICNHKQLAKVERAKELNEIKLGACMICFCWVEHVGLVHLTFHAFLCEIIRVYTLHGVRWCPNEVDIGKSEYLRYFLCR